MKNRHRKWIQRVLNFEDILVKEGPTIAGEYASLFNRSKFRYWYNRIQKVRNENS